VLHDEEAQRIGRLVEKLGLSRGGVRSARSHSHKKSPAQLDSEIAEALADRRGQGQFAHAAIKGPPGEIAESVAYWKERWGHIQVPTSFPKAIRHGGYTATFQGIEHPNTVQATAKWEIKKGRQVVGTMHEGWGYGWGHPTITTRQLTWSGPLPPGTSDPKSLYYGWAFDIGPSDSYKEAMTKLAKQADRLLNWRKKHGKVVAQGVR
jgi:hypothetical protein